MLESMQTNNYKSKDYQSMNDKLLYLDYIDYTYEFKEILVDPSVAYRHQGNFIGLMKDLGIANELYLFMMYINGINNPVEYDGILNRLKVPINPPVPAR